MNIHVLPFGNDANINQNGVSATKRYRGPDAPEGSFAKVYEASVLEAARAAKRTRIEPIPEHLLDEIEAASRLYDELTAREQQVRFDVHDLDRGVVANLVDTEGNVLRPISLRDIVESNDPDPAA
jgi:hypothetical protein